MCFSLRNNILILKYCQTEFVKSIIQPNTYSLTSVLSPTTFKPKSLGSSTYIHLSIRNDAFFPSCLELLNKKKESVQHVEL